MNNYIYVVVGECNGTEWPVKGFTDTGAAHRFRDSLHDSTAAMNMEIHQHVADNAVGESTAEAVSKLDPDAKYYSPRYYGARYHVMTVEMAE